MASVLTFIEQQQKKIRRSSLETLSEAKKIAKSLGTKCYAVIIGSGIKRLADQVKIFGPDKIYLADSEKLDLYSTDSYGNCLDKIIKSSEADYIFFAASSMGRDLAPRVAASLKTTVLTDGIELAVNSGSVLVKRPIYAGKAYMTVKSKKLPAVISLRPNVFKAVEQPSSPEIEELQVEIDESNLKAKVKEVVATTKGKIELTEASVIVSGGRGLKGPENFGLRDQLAEVLGAAVGASRAVVDAGWRPYTEQVGQTGKTVSPNLYIALGISGAIQHIAGMGSSKVIVAINKDPDAPIFKIATYGIVGDVFEVVPALCEELKKIKGN